MTAAKTNRRIVSAVLACVCSATISYSDQGQRPGSAPRPKPVPGSNRDSKESTTSAVTGCVKPGTEPKTYLLLETLSILRPEGAAPQPAAIRDGGSRYQLFTDDPTIDLSKLVGREVSAKGTASKPAISSDESKSTTRPDALSTFTAKSLHETGTSC